VAIRNCQLETVYVQKFIINYCQLVNAGNSITLIWITGHTGIRGNECADEAAKAALSSTVSTMKCPASDFIPELTMHYREVWQAEWDGCSANKLHSVKPVEDQLAFFTLFLKGAAIDWYDTLMATQKQSVCIVDVLQTWSEFKTNNIVHNQDSVQQFL